MTVQEAWNRGNNLIATAVVALAGFAFAPEMFVEDEELHRLDEGLLFVLGLVAIGWYLKGKHKFMRSVVPVVFVWIAFLIKVMAFVLEMKDKEDIGDEFGALILFLFAGILVSWLYVKGKKLLEK